MGKTFYSSPKTSTLALGPTLHSVQWLPGVCCKGHADDHAPLSGADVKKE